MDNTDYKIIHIGGILLLVVAVFMLSGWVDIYSQYLKYGPSSGSKNAFSYDMSCMVLLIYTMLIIGPSCALSLPFYIFIVGYDVGKKVYVYILLCALVVAVLCQNEVTSKIAEKVNLSRFNLVLIIHFVINFLYFIFFYLLIAFLSPSSNFRKMIKRVR